MKQSRQQPLRHFKREVSKTSEGGSYYTYDSGTTFVGEHWQGGGRTQAEQYGQALPYIRNVKISGDYKVEVVNGVRHYIFCNGLDVCELDGIGLYTWDEPDFKILAIKPYHPLTLECKQITIPEER